MVLMVDQAFRPFLPRSEWGGPKDVYTLRNFVTAVGEPFNQLIFLKTIWASVLVTALVARRTPTRSRSSWFAGGRAGLGRRHHDRLLIPFWVNDILKAFAWQLLLARFGPFNNLLVAAGLVAEPFPFLNLDVGVIVGLIYAYLLFMIFPLYSAMESLDPNQLDAARDLGAPWWRIHWDIVIPHAKPGIASGCIVTFMLAAGSFAVPQILGGTRSLWVTQLIYNQFDAINWNLGAAYGLALVVLCLVFVLAMMSRLPRPPAGHRAMIAAGRLQRVRIVAAYLVMFFVYMFLPLVYMMAVAFNDTRIPTLKPWRGFTLRWFPPSCGKTRGCGRRSGRAPSSPSGSSRVDPSGPGGGPPVHSAPGARASRSCTRCSSRRS